jgi:hypothetical protein
MQTFAKRLGLITLAAALLLTGAWGQTTIFEECVPTFTELPSGWTSNNGGSQAIFQAATGGYLLVDHIDDWVVTSAFNLSTYENIELSVDVATYGSGDNNPLTIEVSNDNGGTWTHQTLTSNTPTSSTYIAGGPFLISATEEEVKFRFKRDAASGKGVRFRNIKLTGDILAGTPIIEVSTVLLSGFSYVEGSGPSLAQSVEVSGTNLDGTDVTVTAPANFQVSTTEGSGYGASVTLTAFDGTATDIWVRLVSGLSVGDYTGNVAISGGGADAVNVAVSGSVVEPFAVPYSNSFGSDSDRALAVVQGFILDNTIAESGYTRITNSGYIETPTINFTNYDALELGITLATYGGDSGQKLSVQVSDDNGSTYTTYKTITVPVSSSDFSVIVDLRDTYNVETGKLRFTMTEGVNSTRFSNLAIESYSYPVDPTITVSTDLLSGFSYPEGSGPSAEQSFTVSGINLEGNISITPPTNYEISTGTGASFVATSPVNLIPDGGTVNETTIYVRLKAELSAGNYNSETITSATSGADSKTVTCSGSVLPPIPKLLISEVADPEDVYQARFVELYNNSGSTIDFNSETWYLCRQTNGGTGWEDKKLTGTIAHGNVYVAAQYNENETDYFYKNYGFMADFDYGGLAGNGNDGYFLYYGGDHTSGTLVDAYGVIDEDGIGKDWEYEDSRAVRKDVTEGNPTWTASEWEITAADVADCTPGTLAGDYPLPITLASFSADYVNGAVKLNWETASETENAAFRIYRDGEMIAELEGAGTTAEPQSYSWTDNYVVPGKTYSYVLADVDLQGKETKHSRIEVEVEVELSGKDYHIGAAYPNPFNPVTVVPLNLAKDAVVRATLYDITGRPLRELQNGTLSAGSHAITIDGANLSTGIYFVRINVGAYGNTPQVQKIALMK